MLLILHNFVGEVYMKNVSKTQIETQAKAVTLGNEFRRILRLL